MMDPESDPHTPTFDDEPLLDDHTVLPHRNIELPYPAIGLDYTVYKRRWFVLLVVIILNISNGMMWISFAPIADQTGEYYNVSASSVNWLSVVYPTATIPFGIVATWLLDSLGLRTGIIVAAWLNGLGGILRVVSTIEIVKKECFTFLLMGQIFCAVAQPFALFTPTKVAAVWFPPKQRATANMLGSMANPVGIMTASFLSPVIMNGNYKNMQFLLVMYLIPAAVGVLFSTFGLWSSLPPTPPSASAANGSESFTNGIKKILRIKQYWILAVCEGTGVALFSSITTLLEQILCPRGYSDQFAGICGGLIIGFGLFGAAIAGLIVDKTKKFEEVAKSCYSLATISVIASLVLCRYMDMAVPIAVSLSLFGFFGLAMYPVIMELGVECTYPIAEATSAGLMLILGQIETVIVILVMQALAPAMTTHFTCEQPKDYTYSNIFVVSLATLATVVFVCAFKCSYRRLRSEQQLEAERIINAHTS